MSLCPSRRGHVRNYLALIGIDWPRTTVDHRLFTSMKLSRLSPALDGSQKPEEGRPTKGLRHIVSRRNFVLILNVTTCKNIWNLKLHHKTLCWIILNKFWYPLTTSPLEFYYFVKVNITIWWDPLGPDGPLDPSVDFWTLLDFGSKNQCKNQITVLIQNAYLLSISNIKRIFLELDWPSSDKIIFYSNVYLTVSTNCQGNYMDAWEFHQITSRAQTNTVWKLSNN